MALLLAVMYASAAIAQNASRSPSPGLIPTDEGGAVGYQHALERSRFVTGASATSGRRVEENGFAKVVGPAGVFATSLHNGLVVALPSGSSDKTVAGEAESRTGRAMDPARHNAQVADYFRSAGLPKDQIGGVHANTYLSLSASPTDARPATPKIEGYASVLERKAGKYTVVDSVAWARMDEQGRVVSEWVYWPAIPAKVLADARRLEELTGGAGNSAFLARLPAGLPGGKVVIRHSSAVAEGPFEVFASYEVGERRTVSATGFARHFDVDGAERRLPQERRNLGADYPPKEKPPAPVPDRR